MADIETINNYYTTCLSFLPTRQQIVQIVGDYVTWAHGSFFPAFYKSSHSQTIKLVVAIAIGLIIARISLKRMAWHRNLKADQPSERSKNNALDQMTPLEADGLDESDILKRICKEVCRLPVVKHDRKLSQMLTDTILSFKSLNKKDDSSDPKEELSKFTEVHEKMEYVIIQSMKEIEFLNSEVARLNSEAETAGALREENAKLRRRYMSMQNEIGETKKRLASAQSSANNDEEIRNLEFQLLYRYGDTEKDKMIASLQKQLEEKDNLLKQKLQRNQSQQEDSINKWLFDDADTEFAL